VAAGFKMVGFLQKYTDVMTRQIQAIQTQVDESVIGVMQALQELSASTEKRKQEADSILEATYLAPDANTAHMVENIQKSTDDIFEDAAFVTFTFSNSFIKNICAKKRKNHCLTNTKMNGQRKTSNTSIFPD
jgi:hypothetical protein